MSSAMTNTADFDPIEDRRLELQQRVTDRLRDFKPTGRFAAYGRAIDYINGIHDPHQNGALHEAKAIAIDIVAGEYEVWAVRNHVSGDIHVVVGAFIDPQDDYF